MKTSPYTGRYGGTPVEAARVSCATSMRSQQTRCYLSMPAFNSIPRPRHESDIYIPYFPSPLKFVNFLYQSAAPLETTEVLTFTVVDILGVWQCRDQAGG
jgi:hypothetical protein